MPTSPASINGLPTPTRRQVITVGALAFGGLGIGFAADVGASPDEISRSAEAIHQEPQIPASRARIYRALTDARQFDRMVRLSAAVKEMAITPKPVVLEARLGGAFSAFGGYITGRFIELLADELIVQAWRAGGWSPGIYSIARFQLIEQTSGTKVLFDHTGFPVGQAEHLAQGWHDNYWDPLRALFK